FPPCGGRIEPALSEAEGMGGISSHWTLVAFFRDRTLASGALKADAFPGMPGEPVCSVRRRYSTASPS
ncbi:MAG: hypothetical protein Q8O76_05355, partial [Chloroflexota bacterium]|nr:hypothetical protein [Chloroflexota bacterium]